MHAARSDLMMTDLARTMHAEASCWAAHSGTVRAASKRSWLLKIFLKRSMLMWGVHSWNAFAACRWLIISNFKVIFSEATGEGHSSN